MISITSDGQNLEIEKTVQVTFNGSLQDAHLCAGKIYTQNHKGDWVNKDNVITVTKYGYFDQLHKALEEADKLLKE